MINGGFYAGRVKPGKFEYPKLNGYMSVEEAKKRCESDTACGGFTFKGSYETKNESMDVYFFHLIPIQKKAPDLHWPIIYFENEKQVRISVIVITKSTGCPLLGQK